MRFAVSALLVLAAYHKGPEKVDLGTSPHAFGLVANVKLGMTADELAKAAPELKKLGAKLDAFTADPDGASYMVELADGKVSRIHMQLMKRPSSELFAAWGPGEMTASGVSERHRYFDAAAGLRYTASVVGGDSFAVDEVAYMPLAKLLEAPDPRGVLGVAISNRPMADVVADFKAKGYTVAGNADGKHFTVKNVPLTEWAESLSWIDLDTGADGKVSFWALGSQVFDVGAAQKQALLATYAARWGKPVSEDPYQYVFLTDEPKIYVSKEFMAPTVHAGL